MKQNRETKSKTIETVSANVKLKRKIKTILSDFTNTNHKTFFHTFLSESTNRKIEKRFGIFFAIICFGEIEKLQIKFSMFFVKVNKLKNVKLIRNFFINNGKRQKFKKSSERFGEKMFCRSVQKSIDFYFINSIGDKRIKRFVKHLVEVVCYKLFQRNNIVLLDTLKGCFQHKIKRSYDLLTFYQRIYIFS